MHEHFAAGLDVAARVFWFRAAPVVLWLVLFASVRARVRLAVLLGYVGVLVAVCPFDAAALGTLGGAFAYFAMVSAGLPWLAGRLSAKQDRLPLFLLLVTLFWVIPMAVCPSDQARIVVLVLAWDATLSAYSFVVDASRVRMHSGAKDAVFFVLVNPTLAIRHAGEKVPTPSLGTSGFTRGMMGLAVLAAAGAGGSLLAAASWPRAQWATVPLAVVFFLLLYANHSGLAHLQIGLLAQLGHVIPERYNHPWRAVSPVDFWNRWNTYVGVWLRDYVFTPVAIYVGRRSNATVGKTLGVVATFLTVGVFHDAYLFGIRSAWAWTGTLVFGLSGVLLLSWVSAGGFVRRLSRLPAPAGAASRRLATALFFWGPSLVLLLVWKSHTG